jgi:predicted  nucleic acid-binding Zn-ribbon protein
MSELRNILNNDLETYKKTILEKKAKLQEYRSAIGQLEAEITLYTGALQQCEKILKETSNEGGPEEYKDITEDVESTTK